MVSFGRDWGEGGGFKNTKAKTNSLMTIIVAGGRHGEKSAAVIKQTRAIKRFRYDRTGDKEIKQNTIVFQHFPIDERDPMELIKKITGGSARALGYCRSGTCK